ncbi:helix-turn-helix domain-containing protein [Nocardioides sp. cx-173]|uniref:winged helix-turn-helix domain-containing protein n=1 Tax=Nocardioides sp. cx-173 TaxID=2898796 RepID=UPI001E3CEBC5|nr:helix-turn-helix domain-containing protein [Nocardioides sp. cx-173]MCD4527027.1 helix-turn-helix domain-containing protein [Nocardioides sp. cx-173]UGB41040.1 helix-turn-helix domain-containing protein [Nocardioides sp. cx-173]
MSDDEVRALRAAAHPVRLRILSLLTSSELSAAEVARELGLTHANASYHLRVLLDAEEIVEAGEERIRGGVAKRYRHPWRQEEHAGHARGVDARTMAHEMVRRMELRDGATQANFTDAELWVETEVWERAMRLLVEASELVHAEARPPRAEGTRPVGLTIAAFGMTP